MKILNNNGPIIDPCGTPNNISLFVFYLRGNYVLILKNLPYVSSLPIKRSRDR